MIISNYLKPYNHAQISYISNRVDCLPMVREIGIQSQIESYQTIKKWYLIPLCLTQHYKV